MNSGTLSKVFIASSMDLPDLPASHDSAAASGLHGNHNSSVLIVDVCVLLLLSTSVSTHPACICCISFCANSSEIPSL